MCRGTPACDIHATDVNSRCQIHQPIALVGDELLLTRNIVVQPLQKTIDHNVGLAQLILEHAQLTMILIHSTRQRERAAHVVEQVTGRASVGGDQ